MCGFCKEGVVPPFLDSGLQINSRQTQERNDPLYTKGQTFGVTLVSTARVHVFKSCCSTAGAVSPESSKLTIDHSQSFFQVDFSKTLEVLIV